MEPDSGLLFNLILILVLILANAFLVASELAIVSVRKTRISQLVEENSFDAKLTLKRIDEIDKTIAAIQLGTTITSLGLGWVVGQQAFVRVIEPVLGFLPQTFQMAAGYSIAAAIAFAAVTTLHTIVGEIVPRSIAVRYPEKTSLFVAKPLAVVMKIFAPFVVALNAVANFLLSLIKIPPASAAHLVHTVEELDMIIAASHKEGVLNDTEKEILQNVFKFSDTLSKQIMVPRRDVVGFDINTSANELTKTILENQYTRYPVYGGELDNIVGVLHVKDIYPLIINGKEINLRSILREATLVPETVTIDNLARQLKSKKMQMAIVIDEFGSVSGLVTLEDVLEEIFGEVQDEFDEEEADIRQIYENEFVVNAMTRIDEFNEFFNTKFEDEDCDTIGGLVVKYLGHIAKECDETKIEDITFRVLETDGARLVKLKIKREEVLEKSEA
jgi:CBS domain containing-hemolysin-like protein